MGRIVSLLVLVLAGLMFWRMMQKRGRSAGQDLAPRPSEPESTGDLQTMVPCQRCGVHVPARDAVTVEGLTYCCREHVKA